MSAACPSTGGTVAKTPDGVRGKGGGMDAAAKMPDGVHASSVEHGCVVLMGAIAPQDRAQLVKRVAKLRGVDAVMDLMTEV